MSGGVADFYYREAKRLQYVARSAFKLLEMQKKHQIITRGASVLDLGSAPGAWLQVSCQSLGPLQNGGAVFGVDIKGQGYSVILSDMCPAVTGISIRDAAQSITLGMCAVDLALGTRILLAREEEETHQFQGLLLPGGNLVVKLLEGEDCQGFSQLCKVHFKSVLWLRPKATRSTSREIYLIAKGRK